MNKHFLNKRVAHLLGFAGLIPFFLLSLACYFVHRDWLTTIVRGQLGYGIAILSFLGGVHWGAALASSELSLEQTKRALIWGVVPAMIAFVSLLLDPGFGFIVLVLGIAGAYQVDKRLYEWYNMPDWFLQLRLKLTWVVTSALVLTFIAVNVR